MNLKNYNINTFLISCLILLIFQSSCGPTKKERLNDAIFKNNQKIDSLEKLQDSINSKLNRLDTLKRE